MTCFKCISDCIRSFLFGSEDARNTDRGAYIMAAGIKSTCVKDTYIGSIYTIGACI